MMTEIPSIAEHLGVKIHAFQPIERVEDIVRPEIDRVHAMIDVGELYDFATNPRNCPEARIYAAAKCEAAFGLAASSRVQRPDIDLTRLRASTAGLDSMSWIDPERYGSLLQVRPPPGEEWQPQRPREFRDAIDRPRAERREAQARRQRESWEKFVFDRVGK